MRGTLTTLLVVLLLVAPVSAAAVETTQVAKPSIQSVEVSPTPAVTGESVTIAPTVANDASAASDFNITSIALRTTDGDQLRRHTNITDLGELSPGTSLRVPFDVTFDAAGQKRLRVVMFGENDEGDRTRIEYPVSFTVRDEHPDIRVDVDETLTAGVRESLNITVSNGFERELRSVTVDVESGGLTTSPAEAGAARLAAGEERSFGFTMRAASPRNEPVEITVTYRTTTGLERETTARRTFTFEPLREDVTIDAGTPAEGETTVPVTVGNFGNAPIENVVVRAEASNGSVAPVPVGTLEPGTTQQVDLRVNDVRTRADLDITASYDLGGETNRVSTTSRVQARPGGEIELTGLDTERENGRVHVLGSASNIGLTDVRSVIVRVESAPGVEPSAPSREYFVGTVPASDFVSFDVYATVDGDVSEIPLVVTYLADGERRTLRTSVPYDAPEEPAQPSDNSGGGGPLVYAIGALVALLVVGLVVVGWRSRGE